MSAFIVSECAHVRPARVVVVRKVGIETGTIETELKLLVLHRFGEEEVVEVYSVADAYGHILQIDRCVEVRFRD